METHVRNVGRLFFYLGIAFGVIAVAVLIAGGGFSGLLLTDDPFYKRKDLATIPVLRVVGVAYICLSLLLAAPMAIVGQAILRWKHWAKTVGLMLGALCMVHFPIGTGLGMYAVWVLNDESTEFLFDNVPVGERR